MLRQDEGTRGSHTRFICVHIYVLGDRKEELFVLGDIIVQTKLDIYVFGG